MKDMVCTHATAKEAAGIFEPFLEKFLDVMSVIHEPK